MKFVNRKFYFWWRIIFIYWKLIWVISKEIKKLRDRINNRNFVFICLKWLVRMEMILFDCCEVEKNVKNREILRLLFVESLV